MKMKSLSLGFLVLFLLIYLYGLQEDDNVFIGKKEKNISKEAMQMFENSIFTKHQSQSIKEKITKEIKQTNNNVLFQIEDLDDLKLRQKYIEGVEPITAISIEKNSIGKLEIGSSISIPISDETAYTIIIQNKIFTDSGIVSVSGEYEENGIKYSAIITEGKESLFVSLTTPLGAHEIQIYNTEGYVYKSSDISKARIDFGKSDILNQR